MISLFTSMIFASLRSRQDLLLENLALRHQLIVLQRQARKPKLRNRDRVLWTLLCRLWRNWRAPLLMVQPDTVVRWHRRGFRWYWRRKSQGPGRPKVSREVRDLIRRMSRENPTWGAPRIHGELLMLGIEIGEATVSKYMVRGRKPPSQTWPTFLANHAKEIVSIDFFTVPTATFRILYVFLVLANDRREILHFNVTASPTAAWTGQQIIEAFPWDAAPRFLIRDRDGIYGDDFVGRVESMGIEQIAISPRSPWQNPFVERVIGSVRRECLDHVIVFSEGHLIRVLGSYLKYYHEARTHLGLRKDCPIARTVEPPGVGPVESKTMVGGLHHRYYRRAA